MKASPFYPAQPWPVANLRNHPAFVRMMKSEQKGVYYELFRVASDPPKYLDGIRLHDFMDECKSLDTFDGAVAELNRMHVFRVEPDKEGVSWLVPCKKLEAENEARVGRKPAGYYIKIALIERVLEESRKHGLSASRLVEMALEAYFGEPEPAA